MHWNAQIALAVFIGLTASVEDLVRREIPNWIPATAVIGGVCLAAGSAGVRGIGSALLGALIGFCVFLIFYALGGMGGGDIKLMAGFGAILGPGSILEAAYWAAGVGGVLALGFLIYRKVRRQAKADAYVPYAPAIVLGGWMALVAAL